MGIDIQYDDRDFQRLYAEMSVKHRMQATKGAFRKAATFVRKAAVANLKSISKGKKSAPLGSGQRLSKSIRAEVFSKKVGFRVTIRPRKGKKGAPPKLPKGTTDMDVHILRWAEYGTGGRYHAGKKKRSILSRGNEKRKYTGFMSRYGFMTKAKEDTKNDVTERVHAALREQVEKIAKKNGCKTG